MTTGSGSPPDNNRWTIPSARWTPGGCGRYRNPRSTKVGAAVVLDPRVAGRPVFVLDRNQTLTLRDLLAEGLR